MANQQSKKKKKEAKRLVLARLETMPSNIKISIGSKGDFSRDELIENVEKENKIGEKITEVQLEYLKSLKKGVFYEQDKQDEQRECLF